MGNRLNMQRPDENLGGSKPPKPQSKPNENFLPVLKELVKVEQRARFKARAKISFPAQDVVAPERETYNKQPLAVDRGSLRIKNASPEDQMLTRAQLVGKNVNQLAGEELMDQVEQAYGKRPSNSEMRKLMRDDPSVAHNLRKIKKGLNKQFDPRGEYEELRHYQGEDRL